MCSVVLPNTQPPQATMMMELQEEIKRKEDEQVQMVQKPIPDEPKFLQEVKVLLVDSPSTPKIVTVTAFSEATLPQIMGVVANLSKHNKPINKKNAYLLNVVHPQYHYILHIITDSQNSIGGIEAPLNNSQTIVTDVYCLNLYVKENENDTSIKEASNLVKSIKIESIPSSRSPSPVHGEDNDDESRSIIRSDSSSVNESAKQQKLSIFQDILTIYPQPPEKGGIPINTNDYRCLGNNEFLNDTIIDFYLLYLMREVLSPEDRERTHLFSSHFYTRLANLYDNAGDYEYASENDKRHAGVQRWTKNVDIFQKDFIIVPVNQHAHWYLVIICFPHLVGNDDEPFTYYEDPLTEEVQRPCILIFDSLSGSESAVITKLRGYLSNEYFVRKGLKKSFLAKHLNLVRPSIPKQSNMTDCGIFLLQYVENFFKVPIKDFSFPFKSLSNWFTIEEVDEKREKIADLIQNLAIDFHEGKGIGFPNLSFQKRTHARSISTTAREDKEITIIDSNSEGEVVVEKQSLAKKNKSPWRGIKFNFTAKGSSPINREVFKKAGPCYFKSSRSPLNDEPPFILQSKNYRLGSPPYYLPIDTTATIGIKKV